MLKRRIKSLDDVDEKFRSLYKADGDEFVLDVEGGVEDVSGLKSALAAEREAARKANAALKAFKDAGIESPEKAKELVDTVARLSEIDPAKEADKIVTEKVAAIQRQLTEKFTKELDAANKKTEGYRATVEKVLIDRAAIEAITEEKGVAKVLLPHVKQFVRTREENGQFIVEVIDKDGNPRIADAKGSPMTIRDFVSELKSDNDFARLFDASGSSGSGGGNESGAGAGAGGGTGVRRISGRDQGAMNASLEDIASGKAVVV